MGISLSEAALCGLEAYCVLDSIFDFGAIYIVCLFVLCASLLSFFHFFFFILPSYLFL